MLWLTRVSIAKPFVVGLVAAAVALVGLVAYLSLPINQFPNVNIPVVTVTTIYPGAGPEEVELQVSQQIESAVAGLADVDFVTSTSTEGVSLVVVQFSDRANSDLIANTVARQVDAVVGQLLADAQHPSVAKVDPNARPVLQLALVSERLPPEELFRLADGVLRPRLERVTGVSQVGLVGGRQQEVRIEVDPAKLAGHGVALNQVQAALAQSNASTPAGSVAQRGREYTLRVAGLVERPEDFGRIVVGGQPDNPIRLWDVATVRLAAKDPTQLTRVDGSPGVLLRVGKQNGANTTDVADAVDAALAELRARLPAGADLRLVQDDSRFTRQAIDGVRNELLTAVLLTGLVLFLFLHSPRLAFIVLLSIPTTLLAATVGMTLLGFSLNFLSMLALTLSIGILVDDSIVVLESILRRLEAGDAPDAAALNGRAQIGLAAVAITLVDVVIFAPVGLVHGLIGSIFREFGFTVAMTTLASLFVSFTLTPTLAARLVRPEGAGGWIERFGRAWDHGFAGLEGRYRRLLGWSLHHRPIVLLVSGLSLAFGVGLVATGRVAREFTPQSDQGLISIDSQMPPGTALAGHDAAMRAIEARLGALPWVESVTTSIGVGSSGFGANAPGQARNGGLTVRLKTKPRPSAFELVGEIRRALADVPDVAIQVQATQGQGGGGGGGQPVQLRLQGPDEQILVQLAGRVAEALRAVPGLRDVTSSAAVGLPEVRIQVDRGRAEDLGVTAQALGAAVRAAYGGVVATRYRQPDGKDLDVRLILADSARLDVEAVGDLPLQTPGGQTVRLRQVATIAQVVGPTQIDRRNQERVVTVGANLEPGLVLGNVTPLVDAAVARLQLPPGYTLAPGGTTEQQSTAFGQLFAALGVSILLAYLLMALLYESLVYPLVILCALPVAVGGAVGGLWVFGYSFSVLAMIGMILLVGLAVKNGILLVDRTNHNRRERGMAREEALLEAGPVRLRPILMTSLTVALALTPTVLRLGEGSELRAPLAAAVLGGVVSSTLLTLVVVPVVYTLLDSLQCRLVELARRPSRERAAGPARLPGG